MTTTRKKLIEVALPLEAINVASAREKSIRHGHPSTLHLWWARRPLAAARAVIFAQMVDDPSANPDLFPTEKAQQKERARLFKIIEDLVQWENTTNEEVLNRAREEIWQSWRRTCAQNADHPRASELFDQARAAGVPRPVRGRRRAATRSAASWPGELRQRSQPGGGPDQQGDDRDPAEVRGQAAGESRGAQGPQRCFAGKWKGAQGLAEDVRYYGQWMRDEAEKRIGHLYPKIEVTAEMAKARPDLKPYVGKSAHRDRLALGAHGEEPEPGVREGGRAARLDLHALHQGGQGSLR